METSEYFIKASRPRRRRKTRAERQAIRQRRRTKRKLRRSRGKYCSENSTAPECQDTPQYAQYGGAKRKYPKSSTKATKGRRTSAKTQKITKVKPPSPKKKY